MMHIVIIVSHITLINNDTATLIGLTMCLHYWKLVLQIHYELYLTKTEIKLPTCRSPSVARTEMIGWVLFTAEDSEIVML